MADSYGLKSDLTDGGIITGDLLIEGDLDVTGTFTASTFIVEEELKVQDPIIEIAVGNVADAINMGLVEHHENGGTKYSGLMRYHTNKEQYLFEAATSIPTTTTDLTTLPLGTLNVEGLNTTVVNISDSSGGDGILQIDRATALDKAQIEFQTSTGVDFKITLDEDPSTLIITQGANKALSISDTANVVIGDGATNYTLPKVRGTDGQVMVTDASGIITWENENTSSSNNSTGLLFGGILSVNGGDNTKYDVSNGNGQIVDSNGDIIPVSWSGLTAQTGTWSGSITWFVSILANGTTFTRNTPLTPAQTRSEIYLGVLVTFNFVNLDLINTEACTIQWPANSTRDLYEALGFLNISGNAIGGSGSTNTLFKAAGQLLKYGGNYAVSDLNPHYVDLPAIDTNASGVFQYRMQDGSSSALTLQLFVPNFRDVGAPYPGGGTIGNTKYGVARVYTFTSGVMKIQPTQDEFKNEEKAVESITNGTFITEQSIVDNGMLIAYIIHKGDGTDTSYRQSGKFGEVSGGNVSVQDLQGVYNNSSPKQINIVDTEPLVLKAEAGASDNLFECQLFSDTNPVFSVTANGRINNTELNYQYSTGVYFGGTISGSFPGTQFSVDEGAGIIMDSNTGTYESVGWSTITDKELATLSPVGNVSILYFDSAGVLQSQPSTPSAANRRDRIYIGALSHPGGVAIAAVTNAQDVIIDPSNSLHDLGVAIGTINTNGNILSSTTLLTLNKSVGTLFRFGINFSSTKKNPNEKSIPLMDSTLGGVFQIAYRTAPGSDTIVIKYPNSQTVVPGEYDDGNGTTSGAVGNNEWSAMRAILGINGVLFIMPAQNVYGSLAEAKAALSTELFEIPSQIGATSVVIAYIVCKGNESNLQSSNAEFVQASKFGSGSSGSSVSTMQNTYDNSVAPQITTNATAGAIQFKNGTGNNTDEVFELLDNTGGKVAEFTSHGRMTLNRTLSTEFAYLIFNHGVNNWSHVIHSDGSYQLNDHSAGWTVFKINTGCVENSLVITPTGVDIEGNLIVGESLNLIEGTQPSVESGKGKLWTNSANNSLNYLSSAGNFQISPNIHIFKSDSTTRSTGVLDSGGYVVLQTYITGTVSAGTYRISCDAMWRKTTTASGRSSFKCEANNDSLPFTASYPYSYIDSVHASNRLPVRIVNEYDLSTAGTLTVEFKFRSNNVDFLEVNHSSIEILKMTGEL